MKLNYVRNLIFAYVSSQDLVREATGWNYEDKDTKGVFEDARFFETRDSRKRYNLRYPHASHEGVQLMIHLLNGLDYDTLAGKEKQLTERHDQIDKNYLPLYLSNAERLKLARNARWQRYEAALAILGIALDETADKKFTRLMYDSDYQGHQFKPDLRSFPLLAAFADLDDQLVNSGLFPNSHHIYYYDKAQSVDILSWANRMQIEIPEMLNETVSELQGDGLASESSPKTDQRSNDPELNDGKDLNIRERESLLLIVNAMAKSKFGFNPENSYGPAIKKIESAVIDTNASLSDKTIRRYLKESETALKSYLDRKIQ